MKIKITRADGTVIEAEGTAEECAALIGVQAAPAVPYYVPYGYPVYPYPLYTPVTYPVYPTYPYLEVGPTWKPTPSWFTITSGSLSDQSFIG